MPIYELNPAGTSAAARRAGQKANPDAPRGWPRLIAAHAAAREKYKQCAVLSAEALKRRHEIETRVNSGSAEMTQGELLAAAERDEDSCEQAADEAHAALVELERIALARPAVDATSLRFKLKLWALWRSDATDQDWRVFVGDCERFMLFSG